jgi:multiple sugar transport system permease protein
MALPVVILVGVFVFIPTIQAIYYSFTNWNGSTSSFVGFSNYASSVLSGPGVHRILFNNLVLIVSVPIAVAVEYCVAYTLWRGIRGSKLFRVVFFIPVAFSWAIVGIAFRAIVLQFFPNVLTNGDLALLVVVFAFHWTTSGANILIMLAGLATVDKSLTEAASIDGTGPFRMMVGIVAPQVIAFIDFAVITTLILSCTSIFGLIYAFSFGGPGFSTTTLEFSLYEDGFTNGLFGLAAATGVLLLIITMLVSMIRVIPTVKRFKS